MANQVNITDKNTFSLEGYKIEVGDNSSNLVSVGVIRGGSFTIMANANSLEFDNTLESLDTFKHTCKTGFQIFELKNETLVSLLKGLVTPTSTAGTLVTGATQAIVGGTTAVTSQSWALDKQNASGLSQSITSVVGSTDGTLTVNTNYRQVLLTDGRWGILIFTGGAVTTMNQTFTITYNYTPAVTKGFKAIGSGQIPARYIRLTSTAEDGKNKVVNIPNAKLSGDIDMEMLKDDASEVAGMTFEYTGKAVGSTEPYEIYTTKFS